MGRVKAFFNAFLLIVFTSFIFQIQAQASTYSTYTIASIQQNRVSDETLRKIEKINNTENIFDLKTEEKVPIDEFFKLIRCFQDEDEIIANYTFEEIQSIAFFFIKFARIGVSPEDEEKLERDIDKLLSAFEEVYSLLEEEVDGYSFTSPIYNNPYVIASSYNANEMNIIRSGVLSNIWSGTKKVYNKTRHAVGKAVKETGKFVASACGKVVDLAVEHPVITGIVVTVVTVGIVTFVIYSSDKEEDVYLPSQSSSDTIEGMNPESIPNAQLSANQIPQFSESIKDQLGSLKEIIQTNEFLSVFNNVEQSKPLVISPYTIEVLDTLYKRTSPDGFLVDINKKTPLFFSKQELKESVFYLEGHQALNDLSYDMAIDSFGKAIETNPQNYNIYLDRAYAYLEKGEFDNSLNDYQVYSEQKNCISKGLDILNDSADFCMGIRTGLDQGVIESGKQLLSFAANAISHPIDTSYGIYEAFSNLSKLALSQEWKALSQALVPEVCDLINEWESLSPKDRGERSGFIIGKYGADILIPGAATKIISQDIKGAKEIVVIAKNLQKTEKVIVFEALTETGGRSGAFAEIYKSKLTKNYLKESEVLSLKTSHNLEFTEHALERAIERNISKEAIFEALNNPLKIEKIKIDNLGRPSQRFIGQKAEVVINPETNQIVSVNPTSTKKADKLIKGLSNDQN